MRLIDAEVLVNWIDGSQRLDTEHDYDEVARYIEECPTVDAVEVVRCKDCRWWQLSLYNTCGIHVCQRFSGVRGEHDFCSRGERREEVQDE